MAEMTVDLVAVDRKLWSGKATFVVARTTDGEIGLLPNHIPLLGELIEGEMVRIDTVDEGEKHFAVHGGFLSTTPERGVSILAESAEARDEIDVDQATRDLESDDDELRMKARARLRAAGHSVA